MKHITVLLDEAIQGLAITPDSVVVDATLGAGGHSRAISNRLGNHGTYVGLDADPTAIEAAGDLAAKPNHHLVVANFATIGEVLDTLAVGPVTAILADLGWRLDQFTDGHKGFSFTDTSRLTMTYGDPERYPFTAYDVVNGWAEEDIANVIYGYGEERYARKIARAIVAARESAPIETAKELADLILTTVPGGYRHGRTHPATKTFQALRIVVNDELNVLSSFIETAFLRLAPHGRLAIITFHSLEDRIVKYAFRNYAHDQIGHLVTKKPIVPTPEELARNPRARSAKLRIIEKLIL